MKKFIQLLIILILSSAYGYNLDFFEKFNDEYLENYIKEALLCNHTLKEAQAKSQQFRYEVKSTLSEEFPSLSVAGNYLGIHLPNNDFGNLLQKNSFILPFFVNWELDLLLKTKDKIKSKKHLYLAQKNNQDSVYISLLTDITSCYINILLFDYLIEKQEKIIDIEANNLVLDEKKLKWGAINFTDFNSRKEDLTTKEIALETLLKKRKELLYNFSQLIGRSAYSKEKIKRGSIQTFEYIEKIPEEINVDVIYKRPDIAEIENKLKASKLDVTVAKKDFFPTFKITGLLGFDTTSGGNFFSWNSSFAYLLLGATQDIFKGGQKLANLKIKKSKYTELLENYKQADLKAISEIANALNIIKQDTKNEQLSKKQLQTKRKDFNIEKIRYKYGTKSKTDYLEDKSSLLEQEQITMTTKAIRLVDYLTLYKAVGGQL